MSYERKKIYCATNIDQLLMFRICVVQQIIRLKQIVLFYMYPIAIVKFL